MYFFQQILAHCAHHATKIILVFIPNYFENKIIEMPARATIIIPSVVPKKILSLPYPKINCLMTSMRLIFDIHLFRTWVMTIWMTWWIKLRVPSILQCFLHSLGSDSKGRTQKTWYETLLPALMKRMLVRILINN